MLEALAMAALSAGGQLLSGMGAKQASAKQGRMQMIADAMAREANQKTLDAVNAKREQLGRELLAIPETSDSGGFVDIPGMMAAAEAGGINPITFMQAGGLQAYTNTWNVRTGHNAADAFKLMVPEYTIQQASQVPQQHSMLSAVGGALSAGANAFGTQYRADQSYELQMGKLALGLSGVGGGSTSNYLPGTSIKINGGAGSVTSTGALSALPYPKEWERGDVEVTNPYYSLKVDPKYANADTYSDRYGDLAEEIAGLRNLAVDTYLNVTGRSIDDDIKQPWSYVSSAWNGGQTQKQPWSWSTTPAARAWQWFMSPSAARVQQEGQVAPYLPFPGAGRGITYAY